MSRRHFRGLNGKWVAITGAGSGIGRATALRFARAGANLALCDVDAGGLASVAAEATRLGAAEVRHKNVDVSKRDEVAAWANDLHRDIAAVDVLVNNAGVGLSGGILATSLDDWQWLLSINVWGVIHGCHFFAPKMVARGQGGHIVNLASLAGLWASAQMGAYATTKHAVIGLSEALREELSPHDISVTAICPGVVHTAIINSARVVGQALGAEDFRAKVDRMYQKRGYGPERVADAIFDAALAGRGTVPVTPESWAVYYIKRVAGDSGARLLSKIVAAATKREGIG